MNNLMSGFSIVDLIAIVLSAVSIVISIILGIKEYARDKYEFSAMQQAKADITGVLSALELIMARVIQGLGANSKVLTDISKEAEQIQSFLLSDTFYFLKRVVSEEEYTALRIRLLFVLQAAVESEHIDPFRYALRAQESLYQILCNEKKIKALEKVINKTAKSLRELAACKEWTSIADTINRRDEERNEENLRRLKEIQSQNEKNNISDPDVDLWIAFYEIDKDGIEKALNDGANPTCKDIDVINKYSGLSNNKCKDNTSKKSKNRKN